MSSKIAGSRRVSRLGRLAALPFSVALAAGGAAAQETPTKVEVVGTTFRLTMADGRVLAGTDLVGAVLALGDEGGARFAVRIDAVQLDLQDAAGDVTLYALSVEEPAGHHAAGRAEPAVGELAQHRIEDRGAGGFLACICWRFDPGFLRLPQLMKPIR